MMAGAVVVSRTLALIVAAVLLIVGSLWMMVVVKVKF